MMTEKVILERLELKVKKLVDKMTKVIIDNDILRKENNRLKKECVQLIEKVELIGADKLNEKRPIETRPDKETTIDFIKIELNSCIEEIEMCLKDLN